MATDNQPTPPAPLRNHAGESPTVKLLRGKVWARMNVKNQHFMGVIVGREGFGKSHSALSIARAVDPGFSADDVYFDPKGLLEAFQSASYGTGDMIVLDEAGVGLGKRTWYEKSQVLLNQTLQTVRDDNMGVLFTLPRLSELDSQTIGRLHAFLEMTDVVKDDGYALAKWKNVDPSRGDRAKNYYKYSELRFDGVPYDVRQVKIGKPPAALAEQYEQRKEAFKDELYKEAIEAQEDDTSDEQSPQDIVDEIIDDGRVTEFVSIHGQNGTEYVDKDLLRATFDLSHSDAQAAKKLLEKQQQVAD
jgi:ABC-type dipeptide/oligopeptide/nickel transport system ATPase component